MHVKTAITYSRERHERECNVHNGLVNLLFADRCSAPEACPQILQPHRRVQGLVAARAAIAVRKRHRFTGSLSWFALIMAQGWRQAKIQILE